MKLVVIYQLAFNVNAKCKCSMKLAAGQTHADTRVIMHMLNAKYRPRLGLAGWSWAPGSLFTFTSVCLWHYSAAGSWQLDLDHNILPNH